MEVVNGHGNGHVSGQGKVVRQVKNGRGSAQGKVTRKVRKGHKTGQERSWVGSEKGRETGQEWLGLKHYLLYTAEFVQCHLAVSQRNKRFSCG